MKLRTFVLLFSLLLPLPIIAQGLDEPQPGEAIKKGFDTWSLFLICNPTWLLGENKGKLQELYEHYQAFGQAIGPKHLAVWFSRCGSADNRNVGQCLDSDRNSNFCAAYKLKASESPHIIVTTQYPDPETPLGNYLLMSVNGSKASDVGSLLSRLTDQLLLSRIDQAELDSEQFWLGWKRAYESIGTFLGALFKKTKLKIDTKVVSVEIDGSK